MLQPGTVLVMTLIEFRGWCLRGVGLGPVPPWSIYPIATLKPPPKVSSGQGTLTALANDGGSANIPIKYREGRPNPGNPRAHAPNRPTATTTEPSPWGDETQHWHAGGE